VIVNPLLLSGSSHRSPGTPLRADADNYNDRVDRATVERLLEINRRFYLEHGAAFSETRQRLQPGVQRLIQSLRGDERILDLGCGNGQVAATLSEQGHRGRYLGVDHSPPLLKVARAGSYDFQADFLDLDLVLLPDSTLTTDSQAWHVVLAFALLHHVPSKALRIGILSTIRRALAPEGRLLASNWQFAGKPRYERRIVDWSTVGIQPSEVEAGDHLVDWRRGSRGLRYVHEFSIQELAELASDSGFAVAESFFSDGADGRSGLYQVWRMAPAETGTN
jgi:tRNA (uracil-5-)-methyltransferase TRM9